MSTDKWVDSITHLKSHPRPERAIEILNRVAALVKPIMRKRSWRLPVLAEFFPKTPNLLGMNVNKGRKILLRLRHPHSPDCFLELEEVVETMLHELTHNVHGPHDDKFYKYLGGLQDEYDALKRSGYSGEGFYSKGHRLGVGVSHNVPMQLGRQRALQSAEKRRNTARALGHGGKLGGILEKDLSPRERAAQAAERRAQDAKRCGDSSAADHEAEVAAQDSIVSQVIDLTLDDVIEIDLTLDEPPVPSREPETGQAISRVGPSKNKAKEPRDIDASRRHMPYPVRKTAKRSNKEWACVLCTLRNEELKLQCEACGSLRPTTIDGWTCLACGLGGQATEFWTCTSCGKLKPSS